VSASIDHHKYYRSRRKQETPASQALATGLCTKVAIPKWLLPYGHSMPLVTTFQALNSDDSSPFQLTTWFNYRDVWMDPTLEVALSMNYRKTIDAGWSRVIMPVYMYPHGM
jgi:hypothetical protein